MKPIKVSLAVCAIHLVVTGCKPTSPANPQANEPSISIKKATDTAPKEPAHAPPAPQPPPSGALSAGEKGNFWQSMEISGDRKAGDRIRIAPTEDIRWTVGQSLPLTIKFYLHDREGKMKEGDSVRATALYSSRESSGKGGTTFIGIPPEKARLKTTDLGLVFPAEIQMYTPVTGEGEIQVFVFDTKMGVPVSNIISLRVQAQ